ncbi:hypothetical protein MCEMAEM21_01001 [Oxalobacteraceae bacterium]|jgi:hypothetical protein
MNKQILCLALYGVCCLAHAEWDVPIAATTEANYYADPETKRSSVVPSVWILTDYHRPQPRDGHDPGYLSAKVLNEADCVAGNLRMVSYIYYSLAMGKGDALSFSTLTSEWSRPLPRSPSASIYEYLCPKK